MSAFGKHNPVAHGMRFGAMLLCFMLTSCRMGPDVPEDWTVFRYNEPSNVTSLDPIYARNQANIWAVSQLFNSLVVFDDSLRVLPALARRWEICSEGTGYTFVLRDDVYFHDDPCFPEGKGRRVRAQDFVFSLGRLIDPSLNAPGAWVMNRVSRFDDGSLQVTAANDSILHIQLEEAFPAFIGLLAMQYCSVVPHEAVSHYGPDFRRNPVGTGPFRFAYWKEGVKLVLRRNAHYFEFEGKERLPYLDAVSIHFILDRHTAFLSFIRGQLDMLSGLDASYKDELLTPDGHLQAAYLDRFQMISMPFLNTEYLGMLVSSDRTGADWPLRNKRIRQAVNYGFDREKMLRHLRNNVGIPAHAGFVPVGMPGFTSNTGGYRYRPDLARRLLAEAGYPNGEGLPPITLMTNQAYLDIAQFIQFELSRLNIRVLIDVMPPATLREWMARGEAGFFRASWIADYPDAENYLALFYSPNRSPAGPNYTHYANPAFDALYDSASTVVSDRDRQAMYREMDRMVIADAPVVFLFYDQSLRFVPKHVRNMGNNPLNHLDLRRVRIIHD